METFEKTLTRQEIYDGRIISLHNDTVLLPNGKTAGREVVEHSGGVCVAALTEGEELLLVTQFRYPYAEETLELPAGKLEKGENHLEAGKRELKEETGAEAEVFQYAGEFYPTPAYCSEIIQLYVAKGLRFGEQELDEDEFLNVSKIPLKEAVQMVLEGKIKDGKTQAMVMRIAAMRENGQF